MANPDEELNSDGLEILSIGALYTGPWDKKYWSSSRGKDRYPYPVGYQALRTHKGITYKMDINEGLKGPVFQITSNDRQSASGETPDRAWETFQKKCCSRIKLWHGKRFSGKMDGVEFFGLKNALVQRLLRELVASVNDASEHCSVVMKSEASAEGHNMPCTLSYKHPDLMPYLGETRVTGKRSRSCRGDKAGRCQPQHHINHAPVTFASSKRSQNDEHTISYLSNNDLDSQAGEALPIFSNLELGTEVAPSADDLPFKCNEVSDNSKTELCLSQVQREFTSTGSCTSTSLVNFNSPREHNSLGRHCTEIRGLGCQLTTEEGNEKVQVICYSPNSKPIVPEDSPVNHFGNLCAPDTLDTQQDSGNYNEEHSGTRNELLTSQLAMSEEPISGSPLEESYNLNGSSERSDYDSVGEEIAKSMMTVLLPQAVPLLTYSSRRKKSKNKLSKKSFSEVKLENESKGTILSADVISPAGALASSGIKERINKDVPLIESTVSMSEKSRYVPDSLDNDQCEDHIANQLLPSTNNTETIATYLHRMNHGSDGKGPQVVNNTVEACCCPNQTNTTFPMSLLTNQTNKFKELPRDVDTRCQEDGVHALHSNVEDCLNTDDSSKPLETCYKRTKLEVSPGCGGNMAFSPSDVALNPVKQHSPPGHAAPNSSSVVVLSDYTAPLSESIICRNIDDSHVSDSHPAAVHMIVPDSFQGTSTDDGDSSKASFGVEGSCEEQISPMQNENTHEALTQKHCHSALQGLGLSCSINKDTKECIDGSDLHMRNSLVDISSEMIENQNCDSVGFSLDHRSDYFQNHASHVNEADIHESQLANQKHYSDIEETMKLIGRYSHPTRISSVMLSRKPNEIYLCVSCGIIEERTRDLFLYKLETEECSLGSPYMVGHTSMDLPILKDEFGREVAIDNLGIQFTPDAGGLVLANSIRMPYCREKNLHCSCSECKSCCFEENAIKIVEIKLGYVSPVLKLNTIHRVHCILVCEPQHLIALDESGRIYIWVMSPTWRVESEVYVIPSYDLLTSRIVEVKRIPKSTSMVVGHNGYGEFSLWDIINRTVVSRFSAPASSTLEFLPISLFNWKKSGLSHDKLAIEECVKKLVETTMFWFSGQGEANISCSTGEDIAVWLFICTSSNSGVLSGCYSSSRHLNLDGCWRLGLLINNIVVFGPVLDPSTAAIGTSAGHGIIGTHNGHVHVWELATGTNLGTFLDLEGSGVSRIATDLSTSSVVAIAGEGGQLSVYLHS